MVKYTSTAHWVRVQRLPFQYQKECMSKPKIFYVEDELFLARIVKESLESREFDVIMENDGAKALELFKRSQPDICVLDVMLPNKDGFEIAEEIREINENIPIIFLTAKTQTEDVVKGFTLGANDYIRKPFSIEELIVSIQNLLHLRQTGAKKTNTESLRLGKY